MPTDRKVLGDLTGWSTRAIQLQCTAGLETLSLLQQGRQEVIAIDITERMIATARRKTITLGLNAAWYDCDVPDSPAELEGTADLVHTGRGALLWMMDLDAWVAVIYRLLKPGRRLHVFEGHPVNWVRDTDAPDYRFHPQRGNYFNHGAYLGEIWPRRFIKWQRKGWTPVNYFCMTANGRLGKISTASSGAVCGLSIFAD